jgi:hypothetical protein
MPLIAKEGQRQDPIPDGAHHAVCYSIVDLGTQPPLPNTRFPGKKAHKVRFTWELPDVRREFEANGEHINKPAVIGQEYTLALGEQANLRKLLEAWRARKVTPEELKGFDLVKVLRANCIITTVTDDRGYSRIRSIGPLMKGMAKREPESEPIYFALDDLQDGEQLPERIPEWLRTQICRSEEWLKREFGTQPSGGYDEPPPPHDDDDIPF